MKHRVACIREADAQWRRKSNCSRVSVARHTDEVIFAMALASGIFADRAHP